MRHVVAVAACALALIPLILASKTIVRCIKILQAAFTLESELLTLLTDSDVNKISQVLRSVCETTLDAIEPQHSHILAVDIGGTRTKLLLVSDGERRMLDAVSSKSIWMLNDGGAFDAHTASLRLRDCVAKYIDPTKLTKVSLQVSISVFTPIVCCVVCM
jgi:hexokinase